MQICFNSDDKKKKKTLVYEFTLDLSISFLKRRVSFITKGTIEMLKIFSSLF